jgi:hypothetical protein
MFVGFIAGSLWSTAKREKILGVNKHGATLEGAAGDAAQDILAKRIKPVTLFRVGTPKIEPFIVLSDHAGGVNAI